MNMEKELGKISRRSSMSFGVKTGIIGASVVSNLANVVAGGWKGVLDAQGIENNVVGFYPYLILSNVVIGAGEGLISKRSFLRSPFVDAIGGGILSPIEFALGYGIGYVGGKVFG